jgi:hypothetical protein
MGNSNFTRSPLMMWVEVKFSAAIWRKEQPEVLINLGKTMTSGHLVAAYWETPRNMRMRGAPIQL